MSNAVHVDFKNKKRITTEQEQKPSYTKYNWMCSCCQSKNVYDSREDYNEPHLKVPITISNGKQTQEIPVLLCQECITEFYYSMKDEEK